MLNYKANAEDLHRIGKNAAMYNLLSKASASEKILKKEIAKLVPKRQKILSNITRWARSASFRQQVLHAYDNRCGTVKFFV